MRLLVLAAAALVASCGGARPMQPEAPTARTPTFHRIGVLLTDRDGRESRDALRGMELAVRSWNAQHEAFQVALSVIDRRARTLTDLSRIVDASATPVLIVEYTVDESGDVTALPIVSLAPSNKLPSVAQSADSLADALFAVVRERGWITTVLSGRYPGWKVIHRRLVGMLRHHGGSSARHHSFAALKILPKLAKRLRLQAQDALVVLASASDSVAVLTALRQAQLPVHVLGGPAWEASAPPPSAASRGLLFVAEFFAGDPAAASFTRDYVATYGEPPSKMAARGADGATVAIKAAATATADGVSPASALHRIDVEGLVAGTYSRGTNGTFTLVEVTPLGSRFVRRVTAPPRAP